MESPADAFAPKPLHRLTISAKDQRALLPEDQTGPGHAASESEAEEPEIAAICTGERQHRKCQQETGSKECADEDKECARGSGCTRQANSQQHFQFDRLQELPALRREYHVDLPASQRHKPHARLYPVRAEVAAQFRRWVAIVDLSQQFGKGCLKHWRDRWRAPGTPKRELAHMSSARRVLAHLVKTIAQMQPRS